MTPPPTPQSTLHHTPGLPHWLHTQQLTLLITTYQHNQLLTITATDTQTLTLQTHPYDRPMGIHITPTHLHIATRHHLHQYQNTTPLPQPNQPPHPPHYQHQHTTPIGNLDPHDITTDPQQNTTLVDTRHNTLRHIPNPTTQKNQPKTNNSNHPTNQPQIIWKPHFITQPTPQDHCHLNGLAAHNGKPRYATLLAPTNQPQGWRHHRHNGGALIDTQTQETITHNLTMPHSPRLHHGKIWLLNAGNGQLGTIQPNGKFQPIAQCPGLPRGLTFHKHHAITTLSKPRHTPQFTGLPLDQTLRRQNTNPICGITIINTQTQQTTHTLQLPPPYTELYDIQTLQTNQPPTIQHPTKHQNRHKKCYTIQQQQ